MSHHPAGGCHHQKVVVVDDHLAFCGGIDLTSHRWDTTAHRVQEPGRQNVIGEAYGPYHEVQGMVMGPVAKSLGALARDRWRKQGADRMPPIGSSSDDLWPSDITPDLTNVDVAIARTMPASESRPAIRECEALFLDPDRVAAVIGELNADVVALQEFTYPASVALNTREPVVLTMLDRYECALGPARHRPGRTVTECFGNALLTRHPIVEVHRVDLSMKRREPRGALAATIDVSGTVLHVLATLSGSENSTLRDENSAASASGSGT
jgi:Phospholipase D Active site motif